MKYVKLFEEFINEDAIQVTPESDVTVDDYMTDNGEEIKSSEIVGVIVSSGSEKEFLDYFYETYGQGAFTTNDIETLAKYYNDYLEEITAKETEEEEAEKDAEAAPEGETGSEEDPLAGL